MLNTIFKAISFYDDIRWDSASNYNLINFYKEGLDDDTKLLTHWLCYITDRQMAFERIWDIGGFVFSELIATIKNERNLKLLNPDYEGAFIAQKDKGFVFKSNATCNGNEVLERYGIPNSEVVSFSSRYYPSDYFSILFTLSILSEYDYSLTKFIAESYRRNENREDSITRILFSLYLMTYHEIGQPSRNDLHDFEKNMFLAENRTEKILGILHSVEHFESAYKLFNKKKKFVQKRASCSLRDFFKSPEFNQYFRNAMKEQGLLEEEMQQLFSLKSLQQFELPGDVWNNNPRFRDCILEGTEYQNSKQPLNKILRDYFNKNESEIGDSYPEQFDITFDFVPRMCMNNNCDICPIGLLKDNSKSGFFKTCVKNNQLFCSVALINCGYKADCQGRECYLLDILNTSNE